MNPALLCLEDTLRLLLDEAKQAQQAVVARQGTAEEAFEIGRSQALVETLHTWSNQLQTFEMERELAGVMEELRHFLANQGY